MGFQRNGATDEEGTPKKIPLQTGALQIVLPSAPTKHSNTMLGPTGVVVQKSPEVPQTWLGLPSSMRSLREEARLAGSGVLPGGATSPEESSGRPTLEGQPPGSHED